MIHTSQLLELAVKDQINAGVDIISDGQIRGDMIQVFARHFPVWWLNKTHLKYLIKLDLQIIL